MNGAEIDPGKWQARARDVRMRVRRGEWRHQTSGSAPGIVQGNVAIFPERWAHDFLVFCRANPKSCPLISVSEPGNPLLPDLGRDIDIRTDVPQYCIFEDGQRVKVTHDIRDLWRDDLVTFVLGCSYSFEEALVAEGIRLRHLERGTGVPVFRSNIAMKAAGPFSGEIVVSMRSFNASDSHRVAQITSRYPLLHGGPVHVGDPREIGIADLMKPDWGDPVPVMPGEIPMFWGCGVTPQLAIERARLPFCITHKASHMLITDRLIAELSGLDVLPPIQEIE